MGISMPRRSAGALAGSGRMTCCARRQVLAARREPGVNPEVADRVLRRLEFRSLASLR
ncbi:hypothetical protein GCM10023199_50010 [Actinomycetospora chibensis]